MGFFCFFNVGTAIWNFHSSESCDILEITTAEAKIVLPEFMNGRLVSVKDSNGSVLEEWEEAPPSTVQLPMIQSATWNQSPQYIHIYVYITHISIYMPGEHIDLDLYSYWKHVLFLKMRF